MSNKKKRITLGLIGTLIVLLLASLCLLGNTFARYTSSGSGTAQVSVAKWSVTDSTGTTAFTFGTDAKLSPDYDGTYSTSTARTHKVTSTDYITITNSSDVAANVTITASVTDVTFNSGTGYTWSTYGQSGMSADGGTVTGTPSKTQIQERFSAAAGVYTATSPLTVASPTSGTTYAMDVGSATAQNLYVNAVLTWSSYYGSGTYDEVLSDGIDTWIGQNVASVEVTITYTAVQGSELPTA